MHDIKERIIIFGAGGGGKAFLFNNINKYEIVAFSDNDTTKYGSCIENIQILSPAEALSLPYEKICIASQWVDQIVEQLTSAGVKNESIFVPKKQELKYALPFMNPETKRLARELIFFLSEVMEKGGVNLYLDYGTMLGMVREGDLIDWDDDVDLSVNEDEFNRAVDIIQTTSDSLPLREGIAWSASLVLDKQGNKCMIEIGFNNTNNDDYMVPFKAGILMRKFKGDISEDTSSAGLFFAPKMHFSSFSEINIDGNKLKLPFAYEAYLEFLYGNWRKPKKGLKITDYANRNKEIAYSPDSMPTVYQVLF